MLNILTCVRNTARLAALSMALTTALSMTLSMTSSMTSAVAQTTPNASAGSFPSRPVKIITPYSTGIAPDITARIVAERLSRMWGQQVLVEPRPGGNGLVMLGAAKKAATDGHELFMLGNAHLTVNPVLFRDWPSDTEKEFMPVSMLYRAYYVVAIAAGSPLRSMRDLIEAARSAPDKVSYSSAYVGSPQHFGGAQLGAMTNSRMLAVHFKDTGQMMAAVANGDTDYVIGTPGSTDALTKAGRLRVLAAVGPTRLPMRPEVPTIGEAGGPAGFDVDTWVTLVVPRATPADVARKISGDIARVLQEPEVIARFRNFGVEPEASTPAQIIERTRADLKKNAELVQRIGIKAE